MAANPLEHVLDTSHWHFTDTIGGGLHLDLSIVSFKVLGHTFILTKFMVLEVIAALMAKPARFTKAMLRHGVDYVQQHYGQRQPVDDMPPALAAGQRDFQSSLIALR